MSVQFKRRLLGLAVGAAAASMATSFAYSQEEAGANAAIDEEVIVYGLKGSLMSAQDLKREANTVKDVITASDIGALPDKSVTEALMRAPGVTIERFASSNDPNHFAAEGTGVVVRGLDRVRSEINGRDSFSARRDGGGLNYEDFPAELLGSVEIVKNQTADLIAGGVAGTINLVTRKPLDSEELIFSTSIKASYGDHREEWTPVVSGIFSNVWETDVGDFGFLMSLARSQYKDRGDGVALDNYYERSDTAAEMPQFGSSGTELAGFVGQTVYVPAGVAIRQAESERERTGSAFSVQWRSPDEKIVLTGEYIRSHAVLDWDEWTVQYGEQGFNINPNAIGVPYPESATFDSEGFMTSGVIRPNFSYAQARTRKTETEVEDYSFHAQFKPIENLTIDLDVQKIESTFEAGDYQLGAFMRSHDQNPSVTDVYFDIRGDVPKVGWRGENLDGYGYAPGQGQDTPNGPDGELGPENNARSSYMMRSAMDKEDDHDADAMSYALDVEYEFEDSWITSLKGGYYASSKEQVIRDSDWNWGGVSCAWANYPDCGQINPVDSPHLFETFTYGSDFHGGGVLESDQTFLFPRMGYLRSWEGYHRANASPDGFVTLRNRYCGPDCVLEDAYFPSEITKSTEDREELYAQLNYSFNEARFPIKGNFGLRYVSWEVESEGAREYPLRIGDWDSRFVRMRDDWPLHFMYQSGTFDSERTVIKGDEFNKVLPSFNISLGLTDNQIVRFAYSQNVYLPEFTHFRYFSRIRMSKSDNVPGDNSQGYSAVRFDGHTGNPNIQPEEATSYDLTYEWYFADAGSVTLSLFRKELDNIIRERLFVEDVTNNSPRDIDPDTRCSWAGDTYPCHDGAEAPDSITFPVNFATTTNEGSGAVEGFELAYQQFYDFLPGALGGLGFSFNYTYVSQDDIQDDVGFGAGTGGAGGRNNFRAFNNLDLPGYSDDTVNVALMYEKYDISARLAYNWRSEYLLTRRDADMFSPVIANDTGQLDASISYQVIDQLKIGFEATNLLDEVISTKLQYNQEGRTTDRSFFKTDRRFGLFARYTF